MLIYRFKITSEEHEEFLREITIQPAHTFLDFHTALLEAAELIPCSQASFFLTDKKYKKNREISLKPVTKEIKRYDSDLDEMVVVPISSRLMKETRIKDAIEDPHQRLIYEYHGKSYFVFLVELMKIMQVADGLFPACTRRVGELPLKKEYFIEEEPPLAGKKEAGVIADAVVLDETLARLDAIEEDEEAIAAIEQNLGEILFGEASPVKRRGKKASTEDQEGPVISPDDNHDPDTEDTHQEELSLDGDEEEESGDDDMADDPEESMEHLEDFEDIEKLEIRLSRYNDDPEDE